MDEKQPTDYVIDHIWCGPGKGAELRIRHLPTGISVRRVIAYAPPERHRVELLAELERKLQAHDDSQAREG